MGRSCGQRGSVGRGSPSVSRDLQVGAARHRSGITAAKLGRVLDLDAKTCRFALPLPRACEGLAQVRVCKTLIHGSPSPLAAGQGGQVPPSPLSNCRQQQATRACLASHLHPDTDSSDQTDPRCFTDPAHGGSTGGSPRGAAPTPREPPTRLWRSGDAARGGGPRGGLQTGGPGSPLCKGDHGGRTEGHDAPKHQRDNKNLTPEERLSAVGREPLRLWMINARREQWTARAACRTQAR